MPHLNDYLREEAPLNWVSLGRGRRSFYLCSKLSWMSVEFPFMVHDLPGGLVIYIKLFYFGVA